MSKKQTETKNEVLSQACCLNCGTPKDIAWIYCTNLPEANDFKRWDETGETTACTKWAPKEGVDEDSDIIKTAERLKEGFLL